MSSAGASVKLLGELSVQVHGRDVTPGIGGRVGQLAFSYLVLHRDRPVRRDELADAIWEEHAPADPDGALRVVLSRLRKALGAEALVGRAEIRLVLPEPVEVDLEHLRGDGAISAPSRLDTRELLPGLESDWITAERAVLAELRTSTLTALGAAALEADDLEGAEQAARGLIAIAPFREAGHRLLIQSLAARGEVAEALRVYDDFRRLLRDELASSPSRELAAIHMAILQAGQEAERPTGVTSEHLPLPSAAASAERPALVGRAQELEHLEAARAAAAERGPVNILVGGDPGIGKSRLAAELGRRAHHGGWNVLWGRCHEAALVPYEPLVEALRQYAGALSNLELADLAHAAGTEFLALAPDLARRLPRAALMPVADDPQARRFRLFESVAGVLSLAAGARPMVLILEDLHWADRGTFLLLGHVLERAAAVPLLLVGTYRTTEVSTEHPLATLPSAERLLVAGLSVSETEQIVGELAPGSQLAERLYSQTEGNPLFIVESVRSLQEDAEAPAVAGGIGEVIRRRLHRLSRDAATVVGVGAVLGRSFAVSEVARVSGLSQLRLLDAVDEALGAGIVEEVPGTADRLVFTHALIREVRYREHSAPRRTALHEAAAEAIHALYAVDLDEHLADLATHLETAARDQTTGRSAVEALRRAGDQAASRQAFEDAAGWFERARRLFEMARPSDAGRCDILLSLAESLRAAERGDEARVIAAEAAHHARSLGDGERLARAALAFVGSHLVFKAGRPDPQDIGLLEEAVLATTEPAVLRIRLMARLSTAIYYSERFDELRQLAREALQTARQTGEDDALGWALYTRFWDGLAPDRAQEARDALQELRPIAQRTKSLELASEAAMVQWYGLLRSGRPDLLAVELERSREQIVSTGIPIYRWFSEAVTAVLAVTPGRFEEAEAMIAAVARNGASIDAHDLPRFAAMPMIQLRHHQGRLGELVGPLRMVVANNPGLPVWRFVLTEALAAAGLQEEASQLLAQLADRDFTWLRRDVNWVWAVTAASSACVTLGEKRVAAVLHGMLSAIPGQSVVLGPALGFLGPVRRYVAALAALIGRYEEAERDFEKSIEHLERVGAIPLAKATRNLRDQMLRGAETSS